MTTKHTPGPWRITSQGLLVSDDNGMVLSIKNQGSLMTNAELQANYALIESAPDMVSMLEGIIEQLSRFDYKSKRNDIWNSSLVDNALQLAKHGLAKARGEATDYDN